MTLRRRALAVVGLAFLGLLAAVLVLVSREVVDRFAAFERTATSRNAERALRALSATLGHLDLVAGDWAQWDDAYAFVNEVNPEFIDSNLKAETFDSLDASLIVFLGRDGRMVWGSGVDRERGTLAPLPDDLAEHLRPGSSLLAVSEADRSRAGVLVLRDGAVAVACRAILTSAAVGPIRGVFLLGRPLGGPEFAAIGRTIDLPLEGRAVAQPLPPDFAAALPRITGGTPVTAQVLGPSRVAGYALVRDVYGKAALILRTEEPRAVYRDGVTVARYLVGIVLVTVLLFAALIVVGLERTVLARLERLSSSLAEISRSGDPAGRVAVEGGDELARLARDINLSLGAVEGADQALRESEERYRRLVEMSPDGIMIHCDGTIVFANRRLAEMLGFRSAEELEGREVLGLVHEDSRDVVAAHNRELSVRSDIAPQLEVKGLRRDGAAVEVEVTSILHSYGGRPAVQAVVRDISARKHLEAQVRHAQKLEAIGQLAGGLAHDFNNLLQAILGGLEVLRLRGAGPGRADNAVTELEAHVRRGAALARQLLLFSQREVTKIERLDLNAVIESACGLLRRVVRESIRIRTELAPAPLVVNADRGQLEQVIVNLAMNASDAMPEGGELRLRSGNAAPTVWFEVTDTGAGMTDDVQARIFEPFFTTKERGKGTGLGLAVVHGIVSHHGGEIGVHSEIGHGTTFRVALPRAPHAARQPDLLPTPGGRRVRVGDGERILVVEDEDGARESLLEMLRLLGYDAEGVASGEEAGLLPAEPGFDILLTDVILPGVHGVELATGLKERWPSLRVVVMSGYSEDAAIEAGVDRGTMRYLQKPFGLASLAGEIEAALRDGA
jgi:PAS domain S-box-containing protein